jgi:hypothetical protein
MSELIADKVCVACLNDDCVEHLIDMDGDHYLRCQICGRCTRYQDTYEDAEEAFDNCADTHYDSSGTVLLRISDINEWARLGKLPNKDLHLYDLRNRINGD